MIARLVFPVAATLVMGCTSLSMAAESSYSKLDFDRHCTFEQPKSEEEAGMGAEGVCRIPGAPVIHFAEGDLRQSAGFGAPKLFESFGQFNRMNQTIEWRSAEGAPYAAIVRFFIENMDPATGSVEKSREGQVLVVHRVAQNPGDTTCIVGMVDARANSKANELARQLADTMAIGFRCGSDRAEYHGKVGPYAGDAGF
jgi:hypothetical protein